MKSVNVNELYLHNNIRNILEWLYNIKLRRRGLFLFLSLINVLMFESVTLFNNIKNTTIYVYS